MDISLIIKTSGRNISVELEPWQVDVVADALGIRINDDLSISMFRGNEINDQDDINLFFDSLGCSTADRIKSVNNIIASLGDLRRKIEKEANASRHSVNDNTSSDAFKNVNNPQDDYQPEL